MGYSIHLLEIIKARLVKSNSKDLNTLFEFIEEQLLVEGATYEGPLEIKKIKKIRGNIAEVHSRDLEDILDFVLQRIPMSRTGDSATRILNDPEDLNILEKIKHYSRELRYSKIEKFIFDLTSLK